MSDVSEVRQGNTGKWAFILRTPEGKILAMSDWGGGRNKEFDERYWVKMPVVKPVASVDSSRQEYATLQPEKIHRIQDSAQSV